MKITNFSNFFSKLPAACAVVLFAGTVLAEPALQVDIDGGTYDSSDAKDVVAPGPVFTLRALCDVSYETQCTNTTTFVLSIALTPQTSTGGDYGSIVVNGTTYDITDDMVYGVPPIEEFGDQNFDSGDLSKHGHFPTYFLELAVDFNSEDICGAAQYNVQNTPGVCTVPGSGSYFDAFVIDASGLADGFGLHFDLYDPSVITGTDVDLPNSQIAFAPFSKDARYDCCGEVPEPGALGLLGLGLLGLGLTRRFKTKI